MAEVHDAKGADEGNGHDHGGNERRARAAQKDEHDQDDQRD